MRVSLLISPITNTRSIKTQMLSIAIMRVSLVAQRFITSWMRLICMMGPSLVWHSVSIFQNFNTLALKAPPIVIFLLLDMVLLIKVQAWQLFCCQFLNAIRWVSLFGLKVSASGSVYSSSRDKVIACQKESSHVHQLCLFLSSFSPENAWVVKVISLTVRLVASSAAGNCPEVFLRVIVK